MNVQENSCLIDKSELSETMNMAISKYRNYPSILLIKDKIRNPASFSFKEACLSDIEKELRNLSTKKEVDLKIYHQKILGASKESCSETLAELFNNTLLHLAFLLN